MAGQIFTKTFNKGMNKDLDMSIIGKDQYSHAENYKLLATEGSNSFTLENAEGNSLWFDLSAKLPTLASYYLVGHSFISPYLVLFLTTNHNTVTPSSGASSVIVRIKIDKNKIQATDIIYSDSTGNKLDFSDTHPIKAVGLYERKDIVKVYWTDNYNPVRFINILDENLSNRLVSDFDLLTDFPYDSSTSGRPEYIKHVSGNIEASSVQYAYQFFNKYGQSSAMSLVSPGIVMTGCPDKPSEAKNMFGNAPEENTNKGNFLTLRIPTGMTFDGVRLIALDYTSYSESPSVRIVKELELDYTDYTSSGKDISIIDTGGSVNELTYNEFLISTRRSLIAKTIEIKNNRLFLGDIVEDYFDVDFDARAYRFDESGDCEIFQSTDTTYSTPTTVTTSNWSTIAEDHDCVNPYNDPDQEQTVDQKYVSTGYTGGIGAEGPNVKIELDTTTDSLAGITPAEAENDIRKAGYDNDGDSNPNTSYNLAYNRNFRRQEIYRLGIVFINEKFIPSTVKWINDFKMPAAIDSINGTIINTYAIHSETYSLSHFKRLGIKVTLKSALPTGAIGWQVVMVPREENDRSVVTSGLVQTPYYIGSTYYSYIKVSDATDYNASTDTQALNTFVSPEISVNKNLNIESDDFLNIIAKANFDPVNDANMTADGVYQSKLRSFMYLSDYSSLDDEFKCNVYYGDIIKYTNDTSLYSDIGNTVHYAQVHREDISGVKFGSPSTKLVCSGYQSISSDYEFDPTAIATHSGYANSPVILASYRKRNTSSIFGGNSYLDRKNNTYVGISDIKYSPTYIITYEGDSIIDWFNVMWCMKALDEGGTRASSIIFPCESSLVTALAIGTPFYKTYNNRNSSLMQETAGSYEGTVAGATATYEQEHDLYEYNTVYSKWMGGKIYLAFNEDGSNGIEHYNTRVVASDQKINGETEDSMSIFRTNNYIDLEGDKGSVNKLLSFANQLYFWQDSGFGALSVNPRSLITDNNPGVLTLGTGTILSRYDYISEEIGSDNEFGIVNSRTKLYWVDNNKNEFFSYSGQLEPVSKLKGIQTWINKNGNIGDVKAVYDHKYNDVIFTVTFSRDLVSTAQTNPSGTIYYTSAFTIEDDVSDLSQVSKYNVKFKTDTYSTSDIYDEYNNVLSAVTSLTRDAERNPLGKIGYESKITIYNDPVRTYTITFNELINAFVSFNSFTPIQYLPLDTGYLSTNDNHDLYLHNDLEASKSTYYGTTYPSVLTIPFNPEYAYTKSFDALKWISEATTDEGNSDIRNYFKDTFDMLEIHNDYQYTGIKSLYYQHDSSSGLTYSPLPLARRERTWSCYIPRNIVDKDVSNNLNIFDNTDATKLYKDRIRDKYISVKTTYNNTNGYTFSIPFMSVIYRKSFR